MSFSVVRIWLNTATWIGGKWLLKQQTKKPAFVLSLFSKNLSETQQIFFF